MTYNEGSELPHALAMGLKWRTGYFAAPSDPHEDPMALDTDAMLSLLPLVIDASASFPFGTPHLQYELIAIMCRTTDQSTHCGVVFRTSSESSAATWEYVDDTLTEPTVICLWNVILDRFRSGHQIPSLLLFH